MQIDELVLNATLLTIAADEPIPSLATILAKNYIGALPVCGSDGGLIGIISERDIVRGFADKGSAIESMCVGDLMTRDVITCSPGDDINDTLAVMTEKKIRHLPVLDNGKLTAIVSFRDVMAAVLERTRQERTTMAMAYEMVR
jgi:CBS domain-containing protein